MCWAPTTMQLVFLDEEQGESPCGQNHGLWPEPWAGVELESWLVGPDLGRGLTGPTLRCL